jgi:hypothetical protein
MTRQMWEEAVVQRVMPLVHRQRMSRRQGELDIAAVQVLADVERRFRFQQSPVECARNGAHRLDEAIGARRHGVSWLVQSDARRLRDRKEEAVCLERRVRNSASEQ